MSAPPESDRVYRHRYAGLVHELDRPLAGLDDGIPTDGRLEVRLAAAEAIRALAGPGNGGPPVWLAPPVEGAAAIAADGRVALVDEAGGAPLVRGVTPFASLLQQRGVLHASAVRAGGEVGAFLGESGAGKSTLALALDRHGLARVADDLLPLRPEGGRIRVPLPDGGGRSAGRLAGLFFLERRRGLGRIALAPLSPADALAELTRNGFGDLASRALWRSQFELHARLSREVPAFRLALPAEIDRLDAAAAELAGRIRSGLG